MASGLDGCNLILEALSRNGAHITPVVRLWIEALGKMPFM
jgi:hypothetical protein